MAISNRPNFKMPGPLLKIHGFGANGKATSFPGFSLTRPAELRKNPGNEVDSKGGFHAVIRALKLCTAGSLPWSVFISFEKS